ncbi:hypothetical protein [Streptomyces sp. CB01881]|uniref:hypothetical protein n=1 Tax=Streptomyces sp. CB01881 TaxID=2078691 RepID=UPI000CDC36FF|nr:hypothetical protein [Streptomyces sp. CB01881]AUY53838.1 hypothetical protein C2142_39080 [Streptomyces sp. CB01881]TYC68844.1 hypothetical protein EH183_39070 [Streptomyces sp. CB01881]
MTFHGEVPTPEQYDAARFFVLARERTAGQLLLDGEHEVVSVFGSWSSLMTKSLVRTRLAMDRGDLAAAARAWAVVLEGISWWAFTPDFPEVLREAGVAASRWD